jgi:eukaryotic-like serine/threonine-protein kinase
VLLLCCCGILAGNRTPSAPLRTPSPTLLPGGAQTEAEPASLPDHHVAPLPPDAPATWFDNNAGLGSATPTAEAHSNPASGSSRYAIGRMLGTGGLGTVIELLDRRLGRRVAHKQLNADAAASPRSVARFIQEAWITAQLEHPGIVPIYDAARAKDGRTWYTMRLIRGRSLAAALLESPNKADRLRLLPTVLATCQAIAYAHSRGVIHRDLKPANIMLGTFGETQVVDWGLARPIHARDEPRDGDGEHIAAHPDVDRTAAGTVMGTPAFMSPEQAKGERVDARADVWSLGVILFQVCTGAIPFSGTTAQKILDRVLTEEVPHPQDFDPDLPPELCAIVLRAMDRDPNGRYRNAGELAADLDRYMHGRRVSAHEYSLWEVLRRIYRRRRATVLVGLAAVLLVTATAGLAWFRTSQERNRVRAALIQADSWLARALVEKAISAAAEGAQPEADLLAAKSLGLREDPLARGVLLATRTTPPPQLTSTFELPRCMGAQLAATGAFLMCIDGNDYVVRDTQSGTTLFTHTGKAMDSVVLLGPDVLVRTTDDNQRRHGASHPADGRMESSLVGDVLAFTAAGDRFLVGRGHRFFDVGTHGTRKLLECPIGESFSAGAYSAHDDALAWSCSGGAIHVLEPDEETRLMATLPAGRRLVTQLAWTPRGTAIIAGTQDGHLLRIRPADGEIEARALLQARVHALSVSPNGARIAVGTETGGISIRRAAGLGELARLPESAGKVGVFATDEEVLAAGTAITRWRIPDESAPRVFSASTGVSRIALGPEGNTLLTAHGDGRVLVWNLSTGAIEREIDWSTGVVKDMGFLAPDTIIAAASGEWGARKISLSDGSVGPAIGCPNAYRRVTAISVGLAVASTYGQGACVFHVDTGEILMSMDVGHGGFIDAAGTPTRNAAAFIDENGQVLVIDATDPTALRPLVLQAGAGRVALTADGSLVAVGDGTGVSVYDRQGVLQRRVVEDGRRAETIALSPDGRLLAIGRREAEVELYDTSDGRQIARMHGHTDRVVHLLFSHDGKSLFSGSWDGSAQLWTLAPLNTAPVSLLEDSIAASGLDLDAVLGLR